MNQLASLVATSFGPDVRDSRVWWFSLNTGHLDNVAGGGGGGGGGVDPGLPGCQGAVPISEG